MMDLLEGLYLVFCGTMVLGSCVTILIYINRKKR